MAGEVVGDDVRGGVRVAVCVDVRAVDVPGWMRAGGEQGVDCGGAGADVEAFDLEVGSGGGFGVEG